MSTKKTLSAEEARRIRKNAVEHGASEKIMMIANCVLDGDEEDAAILESYCIDDVVRDAEEAVMHIPFVELRGPLTDTERNWVVEHALGIIGDARCEAGLPYCCEPELTPAAEEAPKAVTIADRFAAVRFLMGAQAELRELAEAIGNPEDIDAKILRLHELSEKMREAANVLK